MKPSGIQVNKPVLGFIVVLIVALVWYLTSGSTKPETVSSDETAKNRAQEAQMDSGKPAEGQSSGTEGEQPDNAGGDATESINLKPVPETDISKVEVVQDKVKVKAGTKELNLTYRQVVPSGKSKQDVLLLHGASFSSEDWERIKTLQTFGVLGYRMVAINLPAVKDVGEVVEFMVSVIKALKLVKPVVVSPSMSGQFSLPLLLSGGDHLNGFVSLAPVNTNNFKKEQYVKVKVPVLIVYGDKDTGLGKQSYNNLKDIPVSNTFVMKDGGHAEYIKRSAEFHQYLYNFLEKISG